VRRAISNVKLLLGSRKLAVEIDKETEEQQQERLEKAERKITDFFTNKLEGETKKSDDKEKAIDLRDYNIFEECENKEKEIYLVEYSYRWYLGLRAKNIFEEEMDVLQDFLNHIWNCYGVFSAKKLRSMLCIEIETMNTRPYLSLRYNTRLYNSILLDTIEIRIDNIKIDNTKQLEIRIDNTKQLEILIDNIKQYNFTQNFYSYHNKRIGRYLPTNVALGISANGLYEIVRVGAYD
jgi:hypothetical protein